MKQGSQLLKFGIIVESIHFLLLSVMKRQKTLIKKTMFKMTTIIGYEPNHCI